MSMQTRTEYNTEHFFAMGLEADVRNEGMASNPFLNLRNSGFVRAARGMTP